MSRDKRSKEIALQLSLKNEYIPVAGAGNIRERGRKRSCALRTLLHKTRAQRNYRPMKPGLKFVFRFAIPGRNEWVGRCAAASAFNKSPPRSTTSVFASTWPHPSPLCVPDICYFNYFARFYRGSFFFPRQIVCTHAAYTRAALPVLNWSTTVNEWNYVSSRNCVGELPSETNHRLSKSQREVFFLSRGNQGLWPRLVSEAFFVCS